MAQGRGGERGPGMTMNGARHFLRLFLALWFAGVLSSCGDLPRPFRKSTDPAVASAQVPRIVLALPQDLSPPTRRKLARALHEAGQRRGLAIATAKGGAHAHGNGEETAGPSWRLDADFQPYRDEAGRRRLAYLFRLFDSRGRLQARIAGDEPVREGPPDPFDGMEAIALPRMAETVTERISARLALLGYGTQGAGLPPPPDVLVQAGPGAEKEIDPDLLAALTVPPTAGALAANTALQQGSPAQGMAAPAPQQATSASKAEKAGERRARQIAANQRGGQKARGIQKEKRRGKGGVRIASVAVTGVTGAPGAGNAELKSALMGILKQAGWPVKTVAQDDSLKISGKVSRTPAGKGRVKVRIVWTARGPDGRVFGTVKQENVVPASAIARGFGPAAHDIAQGAAEGLFQLVARLKKGR